MTQPSILAIIPARGGSKGIPRKNVRPLAGKPLIAHTIEQARATPAITRVVVSTDDAEIGAVAQQYGAEVVWRSAEISGDTASSESALLHVLDHLQDTDNFTPDLVVFLQCTSPIRQPDDIAQAIETIYRESADSLFSAAPFEGHLWHFQHGQLSPTHDYLHRKMRQDKPEELVENGSIYVFKPWVLRSLNNRLGGKIAVHRMHPLDSFQIDSPQDFEMLEGLLAIRHLRNAASDLSAVEILVLDFDGVLTDNKVYVDQHGIESIMCDRSDSLGIARAKAAGIPIIVLSTETNPVVAARCQKLGIACQTGVDDKLATLKRVAEAQGVAAGQIAFVGNDINDLACLEWVGLPIVVADADPAVRSAAQWITEHAGGRGAVREVLDALMMAKGR